MPLALFILGVLLIGAVVLVPRKALGFVRGEPVELELEPIDGAGHFLRVDAARAWKRMVAAAAQAGVTIKASDGLSTFRTSEDQASLRKKLGGYGDGSGGLAAKVDASPHQAAIAVDVEGVNPANANFNAARRAWMDANAGRFGWWNAGAKFSTKEPWHWEYAP